MSAMTDLVREFLAGETERAGQKLWDQAIELAAKVADSDGAWGTAERIRKLSFAVTPMVEKGDADG